MKASSMTALGALMLFAGGCSTVRANVIATGPERLPARTGPVAIYAMDPPQGAKELGYVEVSASGEEGNVETLLPIFVERVAKLGGNAAHIEGTMARFEIVPRTNYDTVWYPCGYRMCPGTRMWTALDETMTVKMYGRAFQIASPVGPASGKAPTQTEGGKR